MALNGKSRLRQSVTDGRDFDNRKDMNSIQAGSLAVRYAIDYTEIMT
jgi:hypothetical protein